MITSLNVKNVATFDPVCGVQINELTKVNFIYGANGTGKTTISNFLLDPEKTKYFDSSLRWQNDIPLKTLVYNKRFRELNFGQGKLNGVFTLGEATKEEIEIINNKKEKLEDIKKDGLRLRETIEKQKAAKEETENEFREKTWQKLYKNYESVFGDAFKGSKHKKTFRDRLLEEYTKNKALLEPIENLEKKARIIFDKQLERIEPIDVISFEKFLTIEKHRIWDKTIVGRADVDIAKLIQELDMNDWVNEGKKYIHDETCPFCQQPTIKEDFKKQLESFFNQEYIDDIKLLKNLKQEYEALTQNVINQLNSLEKRQKSFKNTKLDIDMFSSSLKTLSSQIVTNYQSLNSKIKEPSRKIELVSTEQQSNSLNDIVKKANLDTKKHNDIVTNYSSEKSNLIDEIWRFLINEYKLKIESYLKAREGLIEGISGLGKQRKEKLKEFGDLDKEIKELTKNVTSIQPTINEINRLLSFYGFLNFKIVPASEKGFYQIQREDGTIAEETLSEGEITFVTLLYFLQLAKGGETVATVNEERILVIDDPISSLDSSVLFIVSTLIKEILKKVKSNIGNIKQVIILTHNVYFHKEVSYVTRNEKGEKPQFWILRNKNKISLIQHYHEQNPIQSSYELLWREIRDWENNSGITIQNTMRRILENYFSILGGRRDDIILGKFPTQEEREICRSLLSWANEGSHTLPDDLYIELPDNTIENYLNVFKNIFKHTNNTGHYNMMMKIEDNDI